MIHPQVLLAKGHSLNTILALLAASEDYETDEERTAYAPQSGEFVAVAARRVVIPEPPADDPKLRRTMRARAA